MKKIWRSSEVKGFLTLYTSSGFTDDECSLKKRRFAELPSHVTPSTLRPHLHV